MKSLLSAYASYDDAAKTLEDLKHAGYNENRLLVINRDDIVNSNIHVKNDGHIERLELAIVAMLGASAGILFCTGSVTIPGFHLAHQSPLWMALIIGLGFGVLAGEVLALVTGVIIHRVNAAKYEPMLNQRKYLLFVQGNEDEINYAEKIAHTHLHLELSAH